MHWAADGRGPPQNYMGHDWSDSGRIAEIDQPRLMWQGRRVRFLILECRNDWDQYSTSWGMPKTNQKFACWFCPCKKSQLHCPRGELPATYTHTTYMEAIEKSRRVVAVDSNDLDRIFLQLGFDYREDGMHGRVIGRNIEVLDVRSGELVLLKKWSRLEVGGCIWDTHSTVGELKLIAGPPYLLYFWQNHESRSFCHISAVIEAPGMSFEKLMIGDLHTLDLGVSARIIGRICAGVLRAGARFRNPSTEAGMEAGCRLLSRALQQHYSSQPFRKKISRISRLTLKMLQCTSSTAQGHLKAKAMETRQVLPFAYRLIRTSEAPHKPALMAAAKALLEAYELMRGRRRTIDSDRLEMLLESVNNHCKAAGVKLIPKFHLARHLGELSRRAGNPAAFSEYLDETKNSLIVNMARASVFGRASFSGRLLARDQLLAKMSAQIDI